MPGSSMQGWGVWKVSAPGHLGKGWQRKALLAEGTRVLRLCIHLMMGPRAEEGIITAPSLREHCRGKRNL